MSNEVLALHFLSLKWGSIFFMYKFTIYLFFSYILGCCESF